VNEEWDGAPPPWILHEMPVAEPVEILVLTYTSNLPFFEAVCVRQARARGARVTIVYDADHAASGFSASGQPLTDYVPVPVVCRSGGAFHPKLMVIASETDAIVSIGSGNATPRGWHHAAEVWTHLHADGATIPQVFADLAAWLRRLPDQLWISALGRERLRDVADLLTARTVRPEQDEPLLLTNDLRPLAEQFPPPDVRVDRLGVASPFLDPPAEALSALLEIFRPASLDLLVTHGASLDPHRLRPVLDRIGDTRLIRPATDRYHHGKVIEWWSGTDGFQVTGSANCTRAALLRSTADRRGNCELAVLQMTSTSLISAVDVWEIGFDDLPEHLSDGDADTAPAVRVLGVQILTEPDRVEVLLLVTAGPAPAWLTVAHLCAEHVEQDGPLHWYRHDGDPGELGRSVNVLDEYDELMGTALVTDVLSALALVERPSPLERFALADLLEDDDQLQELWESLWELAQVTTPEHEPDEDTPEAIHHRRLRLEAAVRRTVGSELLNLALGRESRDDPDGTSKAIDIPDEAQRDSIDDWLWFVVNESEHWPPIAQLAVFRVVLRIVGAGLLPHPENWAWLIYHGLLHLWGRADDAALDDELAALSSIGLLALRCGLSPRDRADADLVRLYDELLDSFREERDWVWQANTETIEGYVHQLSGHTLGPRFNTANVGHVHRSGV
jgi:hypothetical protein